MTEPYLEEARCWIGRSEHVEDVLALEPARGMAGLLDRDDDRFEVGLPLPPLWHWLYLHDAVPQSRLGPDGHERLGEFLPPLPPARRMWGGGSVRFVAPLRLGSAAARTSTIAAVEEKHGRSGTFVVVTVRHRIEAGGRTAVEEAQQLVYRPASGVAGDVGVIATPPVPDPRPTAATGPGLPPSRTEWSSFFEATPTALFRFSALTFNSHRIHYDQPYATGTEGYPGLVVHAPLLALLLMDGAFRHTGSWPAVFRYRAVAPVFGGTRIRLEGGAAAVQALGPGDRPVMTGTIDWPTP